MPNPHLSHSPIKKSQLNTYDDEDFPKNVVYTSTNNDNNDNNGNNDGTNFSVISQAGTNNNQNNNNNNNHGKYV